MAFGAFGGTEAFATLDHADTRGSEPLRPFEQMLALEWLIDNVEDQPVNAVFLDALDGDDAGRMILSTAAAGAIDHE